MPFAAAAAEFLQGMVARAVAPFVVDPLEVVDVEHEEAQAAVRAPGQFDVPLAEF